MSANRWNGILLSSFFCAEQRPSNFRIRLVFPSGLALEARCRELVVKVALKRALSIRNARARPGLNEEGSRVLLVRAQDTLLIHHPLVELGALNHVLNAAVEPPHKTQAIGSLLEPGIDWWIEQITPVHEQGSAVETSGEREREGRRAGEGAKEGTS